VKIRLISVISGKVLLWLVAICYLPIASFAQGVRYDDVALLDTGRPVQGATVTVCASGSTGTPCTPTTSIFSDSTLSTPITQPGFQSGAQGNFFFYAACGKYDISITGNGITGRTKKDVQLGPCGTPSAKMPASNITLIGANNGNTVSVLSSQDVIGPLTGNATDQTVYTFTVPAATLAAGKGVRVTTSFIHGTGTASVTYKLFFGATACVNVASTGTGAGFMTGIITNQPASTTAQRCSFMNGVPGGTLNIVAGNAPAENTGANVTVKLTFNVAATDQVTGAQFLLELIQ
jgi:hypothetical protein